MKQSAYAWAVGDVLFPTWQRVVRKRPVHACAARLRYTQWLGTQTLARLQAEALRDLLVQAGARVPYYRELFARTGFDPAALSSRDDLAALPVLTREIVRDRYDDLVDPWHRGRNIEKQTSGTSGVPLRFEYSNASETWRQATRLRAYEWAGYRPGLPTLHYWGAGSHVPRGLESFKARLDRALKRDLYVDCGRQDDASMRALARTIARTQPHAIVAYTHALATFARWVADRGARTWGDVAVIGGAEAMTPADRAAIVSVFGPRVFETYGARETMLIGAECDAHDGLHVAEENVIVEIVRDDGTAAPPGETGTVLVTDLHNSGMPLVRYANGDMATWSPVRPCRCGRTLRRLARVDGRCNDTMRDGKGAPVPGMLFISLLNAHAAEIREFQAVQKPSGEVELRVVPGAAWSEPRFGQTARRLASYFGGLPFRVALVDAIPCDPSGKRRAVVVER
jgi:phenylacetate-CoA ligase